jgi:hypothetical protein
MDNDCGCTDSLDEQIEDMRQDILMIKHVRDCGTVGQKGRAGFERIKITLNLDDGQTLVKYNVKADCQHKKVRMSIVKSIMRGVRTLNLNKPE